MTYDLKIENIDIAYGHKYIHIHIYILINTHTNIIFRTLLAGADLNLNFGHRYGLVGRNGTGKTTLLRSIASRELRFPSHMTVLHVEQEVEGGEESAVESVLECDKERRELMALVKRSEVVHNVEVKAEGGREGQGRREERGGVGREEREGWGREGGDGRENEEGKMHFVSVTKCL